MTAEEFDALEVDQKIYRCNEGKLQSYRIMRKTPFTCNLDRACLLTLSRVVSGDGRKMLKKTAQTYFWLSALEAIQAEQTRIHEIIQYHFNEGHKAYQTLTDLLKPEKSSENCGG